MKTTKLNALSMFACAAALSVSSLAFAQADYPNRTITLVVPFPPGGITDIAGREVAKNLTKYLNQPVVVENKVGAGGNIGTQYVARSKPDGYTLGLLTVSAMSIAPHVTKNLGFNPSKDFTPLTNVITTDGAIVANVAAPYNTVQELIAYAKANPSKVNYASVGNGSIPHLTAEMFSQRAGIKMTHVPYKGAGPAMQDLLANQIPISFETSLATALNNVASGRLKILALTGPQRSPAVPNVPTVAESGYPNFSAQGWFGLFGPANLPPNVVAALNKATTDALRDPEVIAKFEKLGVRPDPQTPSAFTKYLAAESTKWGNVAKSIKLEPN
ncbi:MAG: tripartite tricarboxylate transporter substrate binding protein [Burkholderiaceae bacterium]|nr:tripartite tricarboxylate transporter substrate binding protein [Burkholderiaceae bacterium]